MNLNCANEVWLLADLDLSLGETKKISSIYVDLGEERLIEQVRIPRANNILHSSLPKIENPAPESEFVLEVYAVLRRGANK